MTCHVTRLDPTLEAALARAAVPYEVIECDPTLADTAVFCERYGFALEDSVNTILVKAKTGGERYVACALLAHTRLDVNRVVRKRLGARRVSFASAEETERLTGMVVGGVTPIGIAPDLGPWVDARIMERERVVLGGGNRECKIIVSPAVFAHGETTEVIEGLALVPEP